MEDSVVSGDFSQSANCVNGDLESYSPQQCDDDDMDLNLADTLLELDSEDIADIYQMVSEWEFNFGSLEGSDTEELLTLVQLENAQQFSGHGSGPDPTSVPAIPNLNVERKPNSTGDCSRDELHDRLPSYYTALASSCSAPWIQPSHATQVFNKLPAYITDVATQDPDTLAEEGERRPGKKKLNLAEYRTRREKQLLQQQQEQRKENASPETQQVKVKDDQPSDHQEVEQPCQTNVDSKLGDVAPITSVKSEPVVDVELDGAICKVELVELVKQETASVSSSASAKSSTSSLSATLSSSASGSQKSGTSPVRNVFPSPCKRNSSQRSRRKSSRSPTRSYSSRSSRSRSPSPTPRKQRQRRSSSRSSQSSYSSRSRSRSPSPRSRRRRHSRSRSRSRSRSWRPSRPYSQRRSPSPRCRYGDRRRVPYDYREEERQRQIEERRVIYVGKIPEGTTREDLRRRFEVFGPVVDISLHFRDRGDNYGFVTFAYKVDAYEAVEHGNDDPGLPKFDLSFGGRRAFCKEQYADLDAVDDDHGPKASDVDFETLLRAVKAQLHRRPGS